MDIRDYFETEDWGERLILVEGRDDDDFLSALSRQAAVQAELQIVFYKQHGELSDGLELLVKESRFETLRAIGLTRDADDGAGPARQSLRGAWEKASTILQALNKPIPQVFFFALPDNQTQGRIEDVCLRSAAYPNVLCCAEEMRRCASEVSEYQMDREKSLVAAYLAMMERPVRLGVGALRGYWNLDSEALGPLRDFIRQVAGV